MNSYLSLPNLLQHIVPSLARLHCLSLFAPALRKLRKPF
jgi:hypothetical protein